jgi:hypothetical protein
MKNITMQQIEALLQTIYQTNISAQTFDAVKKMLLSLPEVKEEVKSKTK